MSWVVMLSDNYHHMDDDNPPARLGDYASAEEAIAAARGVVDEFLASHRKDGMQADELFRIYMTFGDEPILLPRDPAHPFDGNAYARDRCAELCA